MKKLRKMENQGFVTVPDAEVGVAVAKEWVMNKGWDVERYTFSVSAVQSCPLGGCRTVTNKLVWCQFPI